MNWTELDWKALDRLRDRFLSSSPAGDSYWTSPTDLASYDATFGERIGWKWDAVLDELVLRRWSPKFGPVVDWGCGSGIAGRRVLGRFGSSQLASMVVWDKSSMAALHAHDAAKAEFPDVDISVATPGYLSGGESIGLLLLSHVLNELSPADIEEVRALARRARALIWVEPGTHAVSRALGRLRDDFLGEFDAVAPCTHAHKCPMFDPANERHWCHHFASPPPGIFADSNWVKFGQRAGIDLRSLPYSFIAMDRDWKSPDEGLSRVIGRPEHFKPYARILNCSGSGLEVLTVPKRDNSDLYKELDRTKLPLVYRWTRDGDKVTAGVHLVPRT